MNIKRVLALIISVLMIFSLAACGNKNDEVDNTQESPSSNISEEYTEDVSVEDTTSTTTSAVDTSEATSTSATNTDEASTAPVLAPTKQSDNPADWSIAQIVDAYKSAAKKTHSSVKSQHSIEIKSIKVNNDEIPSFVQSIMKTLLKNNSSEKDGITGGYNNLVASDVASAKAYKNGSALIIEMTMKKQTAGANEDANSGSVGHAITTVGDIGVVTKQLEDLKLPLELNEKETKIYYTNPTVKVVIDPNGKIVNGTWQYTVDIRLNNYKAFGQPVDSTSVVMVNTLTVNGGFKK
ncbi:MAG: hypothetical protein IJ447_04035 [Clostridia bacterium]|nr:hypothetical protein [Clostridia bacterium]